MKRFFKTLIAQFRWMRSRLQHERKLYMEKTSE